VRDDQRQEQLEEIRAMLQKTSSLGRIWEHLSEKTPSSQGDNLRQELVLLYHGGDLAHVNCFVSGVKDDAKQAQSLRVVASHLWPRSKRETFSQWKEDGSITSCDGINDAANGLLLLNDIENDFDKGKVCFLCNPFNMTVKFYVLDTILRENLDRPRGSPESYKKLHEKVIQVEDGRRPSFQILSMHAKEAVDVAERQGWITVGEATRLREGIKVASPRQQ